MKKLFFFVAFVAMSILSMAQKNQLVWLNGRLQYGDSLESIDPSIYNLMEDVDTLPLLLPRTLLKVERDTIVRNVYIYDTIVDVKTQIIHETVYITVPCPETPVTPEDSTSNTENGYEYVDLGLSVKWATCNVGATKPEEYGDYFAWGEVEPKEVYDWTTYKWCNGSSNTLTKYNNKSSYGTVDNKTTLELCDDAARANWGGNWRMPTKAEQDELRENCTWTWTNQNGISGYKVTSNKSGYTGKSIFLPAAGYRNGSSLADAKEGDYWSSSLYLERSYYAYNLDFNSSKVDYYTNNRYYGRLVRPVYGEYLPNVKVIETYDTLCYGDSYTWAVNNQVYSKSGAYNDTIKNSLGNDSIISTLHLTILPKTLDTQDTVYLRYGETYDWNGKTYDTSGDYSVTLQDANGCDYTATLHLTIQPAEDDVIKGKFSVSPTKTVYFSKGNLQYNAGIWRFAKNQVDYIGASQSSDGWVDLFSWGYGLNFNDWGMNKIGDDEPNTWRTLSYNEWYYLCYTRPNAENLIGIAQVNGKNGLVLLPDDWSSDNSFVFKPGFHSGEGAQYYAKYQTFSANQWSELEKKGAIFLPAAGYKYNMFEPSCVSRYGCYWSCSESAEEYASSLSIRSNMVSVDKEDYKHFGFSVRLAKDTDKADDDAGIWDDDEEDENLHPSDPVSPKPVIGVFSVSSDKRVTFSFGNLQYHSANEEWRFAEHQWSFIGETYNDGWIDLFGWSGNSGSAKFGVSTSSDYSDYAGSFVDWGKNKIGEDLPNTWRTLTNKEWEYLFYSRPNNLIGVAQVNGVNGLVLLPDDWSCGIPFKSGFMESNNIEKFYYAIHQTFTKEQWIEMEENGAVFLPAAGYRYGSVFYNVQLNGYYWGATDYYKNNAYYLDFYFGSAMFDSSTRHYGRSVRLVKDL